MATTIGATVIHVRAARINRRGAREFLPAADVVGDGGRLPKATDRCGVLVFVDEDDHPDANCAGLAE
jgi:hypothetical protein